MNLRRIKQLVFLALVSTLIGCVQTKTIPGYAKAGDYIVVGLGGIQRNAGGAAVLKPEDLTVTLTDANNVDHNLEPQYLFKSYPDYSAYLNSRILDGAVNNVGLTDLVPYDGGWFAVVPLTNSVTDTTPLALAVGPATVSVTSPKLTNIGNAVEGNLNATPIDILPGISALDSDYIKQFIGYPDDTNSFVVSPGDLTGIDAVAGGYLLLTYNDDSFFAAGLEPVVVPTGHNPYVDLSYNVIPNGDGTGSIVVTLLNDAGFKSLATAQPNSSLLSDLSVKLIYYARLTSTPTQAKANFSIDTVNSYYIDLNGDVLSGVAPQLTHTEDL